MVSPYRILKNKIANQIIREVVLPSLVCMGARAFGHMGLFYIYSGPYDKFETYLVEAPCLPYINHSDRTSAETFPLHEAAYLDDSDIGALLFRENNLYAEIEQTYTNKLHGKLSEDQIDKRIKLAIDKVMAFVSLKYIEAAFGECVAHVCGAGKHRMARLAEIRPLVANENVEIINGWPRQPFIEFYNINRDEAFQLIGWTDLLRAKDLFTRTPSIDTQRAYEQFRFFLINERTEMAADPQTRIIAPGEARQREDQRGRILSPYGMDHIPGEIEVIAPGSILSLPQRFGGPLKTYRNQIIKPVI
ncbi:MAG: hypothetical protein FWF24_02685 [Alphaproteobacteria bacterium]|nr:hypothetical protein [Alphaproteobacteria bacterium]